MLRRSVVPVEGEIIANRFRLVRELGRGSMGTVWLAHHVTLEVPCAVKFIGSEATNDPTHRARFHIEARTIAQLNSPNVVRILDHDLGNDRPAYIAMEFLDGEDLWSRLHRRRRLDADATYAVVAQVARGLSKAHGAGIVHRDLKPENIFIAHEGGEEVIKLLDFGIAKWTAFSPIDEAGIFGTPEYMGPEQARGEVDPRADLWSLAVIAYQCLTGELPFSGDVPEILAHITIGSIPVPSKVAPDIPPGFDRFWARATSRTIGERFGTASELADALGKALGVGETEPETVRRVEGRARKNHTRFPAAAAGLVAALIAMMAGAGHDQSSLARANLRARRVVAIESSRLAYAPLERTEASRTAPVAADANAATTANARTVARGSPESHAVYVRPLSPVVAPAVPTPPVATDARPKEEDEDAVLDLGI